jgi:predicted RNA-binding Zn-ribbon protein involved in translation (DUF1610 family)
MANEKRLIDANALKAYLMKLEASGGHKYYRKGMDDTLHYHMPNIIDDAPTVDAVEVVHGRWIDVRGIPSVNRKDVPVVKCSKCEIYFCDLINNHHYMYHYCPNCGADMRERETEDDN